MTRAERLVTTLLGVLASFLAVQMLFSIFWEMTHDTPILHYVAWLIQNDYVPYGDVFETSMPATFLFHGAIGRLFGYGDLAFRAVDVALTTIVLGVAYLTMREFGARTAAFAAILFGLAYLGLGAQMGLQKDYVGIMPIAAAVGLAFRRPSRSPGVGLYVAVGALFGLGAAVKPHLVVGLPVVLLYLVDREGRGAGGLWVAFLTRCVPVGLAGALVFSLPILWVASRGGAGPFFDIFLHYLPLHLQLNEHHAVVSGVERALSFWNGFTKFGELQTFLMPCAVGAFAILTMLSFPESARRKLYALLGLIAAYAIYPAFSGQFWSYHWMPLTYFVSLGASLILIPILTPPGRSEASGSRMRMVVGSVVLGVFLVYTVRPSVDFLAQISGAERVNKGGRIDEINAFLRENMDDEDLVQPLDWTGGAVHAMLRAEAYLATRYIFDYQFYHHVSDPYIQARRAEFLEQLDLHRPRWVINMLVKPRPVGVDTTTDFRELQDFLGTYYNVAHKGQGYFIYEIRRADRNSKGRFHGR